MEEKIWNYIVKTFLGGKTDLRYQDFSFNNATLDSLSHVKLVFFLEREFNVSLSTEEMNKERFSTVEKIAALVRSKQNAS